MHCFQAGSATQWLAALALELGQGGGSGVGVLARKTRSASIAALAGGATNPRASLDSAT